MQLQKNPNRADLLAPCQELCLIHTECFVRIIPQGSPGAGMLGRACGRTFPPSAGRGHTLPGCAAARVALPCCWFAAPLAGFHVSHQELCQHRFVMSPLTCVGKLSHLKPSWLQFTENRAQPLLLYGFVYSLCSLRLNSSWFMSAWCQSKLFSLDLCWNLILQTVTVCYWHYLNLVVSVFLTDVALVCFM